MTFFYTIQFPPPPLLIIFCRSILHYSKHSCRENPLICRPKNHTHLKFLYRSLHFTFLHPRSSLRYQSLKNKLRNIKSSARKVKANFNPCVVFFVNKIECKGRKYSVHQSLDKSATWKTYQNSDYIWKVHSQ